MSKAARAVLTIGGIITIYALAYALGLIIAQANEGTTTLGPLW